MRINRFWAIAALVVLMLAANVPTASATPVQPVKPADFPYETKVYEGKTLLAGFDPLEYGGNDNDCRIPTGSQPEMIHIGEVVSSPGEGCRSVVEWSLKVGTETIIAGTYALEPGEWFYIPKAVAGDQTDPRYVGTLYVYPMGWNAHKQAVYLAADRDARDGTLSVVGLSPTDDFVVGLAGTTNPGGGGAPGSNGNAGEQVQPATQEDEVMYCVVTSNMAKVNVRSGPGTQFSVVRTVLTGTEIPYFGATNSGDWKIVGEEEFILAKLCVSVDQADG